MNPVVFALVAFALTVIISLVMAGIIALISFVLRGKRTGATAPESAAPR